MPTTKKTASEPKKGTTEKTSAKKKPEIIETQKVRIILKSFDYIVADKASKLIIDTAERGGSIVSGPVPLATKIKKFTINRSFFVHKDARDQYEMRIHKRLLDIKEPTPQTIELLQNLSLPEGVDIEIKMM